jgi:serine/threonine-protein kinase HipA
MKTTTVWYEGWGERWHLATLADDGRQLLFEYSPEALRRRLELSPRHLKLRAQAYAGFPAHQLGLPGLVSDALPDGWGLLLMDRLFRQNGLDPVRMSVLDRLAFVGSRAMGALSFEPAQGMLGPAADVGLLAWAQQSQSVLSGQDSVLLRQLAYLGGSPQGARPKVLVSHNPHTHTVGVQHIPGGDPWIVKFQAQGEHKEVCLLEQMYAQLVRDCGIDMPETRYFDLDGDLAAFGAMRFDVQHGLRVPTHSLAGLLHADFRLPGAVDYTTFLRATRFLTGDEREVNKAYERAVFNVLFHNRDDHPKNFSYLLTRDGRWKLSPAYDVTFCEGPGGWHQMDVCGEAQAVTRRHVLQLASEGGVNQAWAANVIDTQCAVAQQMEARLQASGARAPTCEHLLQRVQANAHRLMA